TGSRVPNAKLQATETATGIRRNAVSNGEGYYQFNFLPLGTYEVETTVPGLQADKAIATAELNKATFLDIPLHLSGAAISVTVNEAAPLINSTSGQVSRSLDDHMIDAVPTAGRNFLTLAALLPGFQTNPTSGQDNYTLSSGSSVSFNGAGTRG